MPFKILLADDSMTAQNMARKILSEAGYEVVTVSNGAAALKKFTEVAPNLVILDIFMPGYSGLEVCERVKRAGETPVLLSVGKLEPYRQEDAIAVHANGVIVKPFEATELLSSIDKVMGKLPITAPAPEKPAPPPAAPASMGGVGTPLSFGEVLPSTPPEPAKQVPGGFAGVHLESAQTAPAPAQPVPTTPTNRSSLGAPPQQETSASRVPEEPAPLPGQDEVRAVDLLMPEQLTDRPSPTPVAAASAPWPDLSTFDMGDAAKLAKHAEPAAEAAPESAEAKQPEQAATVAVPDEGDVLTGIDAPAETAPEAAEGESAQPRRPLSADDDFAFSIPMMLEATAALNLPDLFPPSPKSEPVPAARPEPVAAEPAKSEAEEEPTFEPEKFDPAHFAPPQLENAVITGVVQRVMDRYKPLIVAEIVRELTRQK